MDTQNNQRGDLTEEHQQSVGVSPAHQAAADQWDHACRMVAQDNIINNHVRGRTNPSAPDLGWAVD